MQTTTLNDRLSKRIALLKNVPLFAELTEADLAMLVDDFQLKRYEAGEIIFHQGDTSRELYVILQGSVRVFKTSPSGNETSLQIFSTHNIIGELASIDDRPRSATAKAIVPSDLLVMPPARFLHHMRTKPDLALSMTRLLARKLRWTAAYAEAVVQYDCAGRLLYILLRYNEQFGQEEEAGKRYVLELSMNQTDLASLVGARREWVNRLLRDWRKRGLIEYHAGKLTILDLPRVEAERDSRLEACVEEW
jgi:CRP/FNR family cyclic AMP-dependent transcriptional regulator